MIRNDGYEDELKHKNGLNGEKQDADDVCDMNTVLGGLKPRRNTPTGGSGSLRVLEIPPFFRILVL